MYICTGRYNCFFEGFYRSCKKYLLPQADKHFFVFTDDMKLVDAPDVTLVYKKCAGFPADTLFKFDIFLQVERELKEFDYLFFFNSNFAFMAEVGEEILPDSSGIVAAEWPGKRKPFNHPMFYPYERRRQSLACVRRGDGHGPYRYYMGGLNGGTSEAYMRMIHTLSRNIRQDYDNGIVAQVHDESHINHYLRSHCCKVVPHGLCWPEEWPHPDFEPKMILRDKAKIHRYFDHGRDHSMRGKLKKIAKTLRRGINWWLFI